MNKVTVWECPNCAKVFDLEPELSPLYGCAECGNAFTRDDSADGLSNRCPDCNKFSAKIDDKACPECAEAWEDFAGETRFRHDDCDEYHVSSDDVALCIIDTKEAYAHPQD